MDSPLTLINSALMLTAISTGGSEWISFPIARIGLIQCLLQQTPLRLDRSGECTLTFSHY